ncbi:MAG TPA: family 1 glycosylhydrolase [Chitinophagaceae bacterium]|nr:family 1 glycosylhydrolase [Chitinophagaceae bacterium]
MSTETNYQSCNPEVWGGIECTINRVGNCFRDQLIDAGHYNRAEDIAAIASLGIKKLRYPVLWEKHQPLADQPIDWSWTEAQLQMLKENGITPIAGLLHHGSGPEYTSLQDDAFPEKLAAYATLVATQFPWLEYYTPVNEPLTTARFSGLYGFWYPHVKNEKQFVEMLLRQVKGIILSMEAIRKINPEAKLVQTEDLAKIHSTPLLAYQAAFENKRRWWTYDLLCGKFNRRHPAWAYFISLGIRPSTLDFFTENYCIPEVLGFNYYATSERYLDQHVANYPRHFHGGNGRHKYADVDAASQGRCVGLGVLLKEAWERYKLPLAITECHLNCTREEQMRWLQETWTTCCSLVQEGVSIKAVTAWSLFGSHDWDSLLLEQNNHYESGVFDLSQGYLRPTILTKMIRTLAEGKPFHHPLLAEKGWWAPCKDAASSIHKNRPLLAIDLAADISPFQKVSEIRKIHFLTFAVSEDTVETGIQVDTLIKTHQPWAIMIAMGNNTSETLPVIKMIEAMGRAYAIPVLLVSSGNDDLLPLTENNEHTLIVQNDGADGMKFADKALDLLIDEETGIWCVAQTGVLKFDTVNLELYS